MFVNAFIQRNADIVAYPHAICIRNGSPSQFITGSPFITESSVTINFEASADVEKTIEVLKLIVKQLKNKEKINVV